MATIEWRTDPGGWRVRWNPRLAQAARENGDWPDRTVAEFARERASAHPDRIQLVDGDVSLSCATLYRRGLGLAAWFDLIGLKAGDVVSFQLPNWWEASVIDLACAMTGVVANPIVPINRDAEVTYMLGESRTQVMFVPPTFRKFDYVAMMWRIIPTLAAPPRVVQVRGERDGFPLFDEVLQAAPPLEGPRPVDPDSVKLLMYTSGTTGRPKGVLHSHNTIHADSIKMKPSMGLTDDDVTFCPSPVTHVSGYLWVLNQPWCGNLRAVMVDTWEPERAFDLMRAHRCSFMVGATPFLQDLVAVAKRRGETLPDLRSYLCGGAAVPPSLVYEAAELFPNCLPWRTFGATESPTMTGPPASRAGLKFAAETDGRLNRSEVKIVDLASGATLPPGEEGEILVREPSMALCYARAEDNEAAYDEDGFFRMGDLGKLVYEDHIVCTGRKKDLIIRAGENISAKEIEDVLHRSPRIAEAAVVSMPSRKTGEAICAFVVTRDGAPLSLAEVARLVQDAGLARQKTPEHVQLVAELPKNPAGKVRKDQLREAAKAFMF
ncbi:MAG TPA: AMP-binding protein [Nevskiaceae bacterium]|nr:AMP-binding protein [Nevskiaceae bacterium]